MANTVNVKWPGQHIADDSTHRLVTDAQIERWNSIDRVLDDTKYIELTPENISQYTCTKPDEYWTDMGLADGTIFDSSSLDEGNYIIKLGMDKLIKNPNVKSIDFRFGKDGYTYKDYVEKEIEYNNGNMTEEEFEAYKKALEESLGYQAYVDYTIETQTFIFLAMFFEQEFGELQYFLGNTVSGIQLFTSVTNCEDATRKIIKWIEAIRIKIIKEPYGPENNMYVLKRYLFFDMNIVDYFGCYNYKWNGETESLTDDSPWNNNYPNYSDYPANTWIPCEFTGVPNRHLVHANNPYLSYTTTLESKTSREYVPNFNDMHYNGSYDYSLEASAGESAVESFDVINITNGSFQARLDANNGLAMFNRNLSSYQLKPDGDGFYGLNLVGPYAKINYDGIYLRGGSFGSSNFRIAKINGNRIELGRFDNNNNYNPFFEMNEHDGLHYTYHYPYHNHSTYFGVTTTLDLIKYYDNGDEQYLLRVSDSGIWGKLGSKITFKTGNDDITYNNTESVTIDLSEITLKTTYTSNWNYATVNGEYSSDIGATNAPTSTIAYMGSVVRGETSITQKLYADTDDLTAVSEYIRRGKITVDSNNKETITWGNWYCVDYAIPRAE